MSGSNVLSPNAEKSKPSAPRDSLSLDNYTPHKA
jgi:hypothetical protein